MKIALLSGAYKNAGDFLIEKRCIDILEDNIPNCEIKIYKRNVQFDESIISEVNNCNCIVIGGGPAYSEDFYPGTVKLAENIDKIKIPIFTLGLGWWGTTCNYREIKLHNFNESSIRLLKKMSSIYPLSCRDWGSYHVLKNAGLNAVMTGCVAWYNKPFICNDRLIKKYSNVICVSDPAHTKYYYLVPKLIERLKEKYPNYIIKFIFHRGSGEKDDFTDRKQAKRQKQLKDIVLKNGCQVVDISNGAEGFSIYDNCLLHIGFRVHAHIYNLSIRNKSILIAEDSRGVGVNESLGLPFVKGFKDSCFIKSKRLYYKYMNMFGINKWSVEELIQSLSEIDACEEILYQSVFSRMQSYYEIMVNYVKGMAQTINNHNQFENDKNSKQHGRK